MDASEYLTKFNSQMAVIVGICETLEENSKTSLPKLDKIVVTYKDIRDCLDSKSKGSKRYIVTETETEFLIHRMIDNVDLKHIYEKIKPKFVSDNKELKKQIELVHSVVLKFMNLSDKHILSNGYRWNYESFLKHKVVPYTYIHKNIAAYQLFKNTQDGATQTLKIVLQKMCEDGVLVEVDRKSSVEIFGMTAKLYQLKKGI